MLERPTVVEGRGEGDIVAAGALAVAILAVVVGDVDDPIRADGYPGLPLSRLRASAVADKGGVGPGPPAVVRPDQEDVVVIVGARRDGQPT